LQVCTPLEKVIIPLYTSLAGVPHTCGPRWDGRMVVVEADPDSKEDHDAQMVAGMLSGQTTTSGDDEGSESGESGDDISM
jgi:hypothetical protein